MMQKTRPGAVKPRFNAYRESLDLCRQLRTALGDSPQVLRDLSVSLNKLGSRKPGWSR